MEEYLKVLLGQIRCKKAHPMIEAEIRDHLESQIETNMELGMNREKAVIEAVKDMGSPLETGIALNRIHRPAVAGEMIVLMLVVASVSVLIHLLIGNVGARGALRSNFMFHTLTGFVLMLLIYHLDYSLMAIWGKRIAFLMLVILLLATFGIGVERIGGTYVTFEASYFGVSFTIYAFAMLYVPMYGAVLYQYYGTGLSGVVKALPWLVVPVLLSLRLSALFLAVILFLSLSLVLSVAVWKQWFMISRVKFLTLYWGIIVIFPIVFVYMAFQMPLLAEYQMNRLMNYMRLGGHVNGMREQLMGFYKQAKMLGGNGAEITQGLMDFDGTYIFTYITSNYGMIAAGLIVVLIVCIIMKAFRVSLRQRNQLGMIMGCGCGSVFMVNAIFNLLHNFGLIPVSGSFFPFFTYGGSFLITSYVLMGMILSVYRQKNIVPIRFEKKKVAQ